VCLEFCCLTGVVVYFAESEVSQLPRLAPVCTAISLGLFDPEDGGDISLRDVAYPSADYTALYPRR
jgi:hypothetical protein